MDNKVWSITINNKNDCVIMTEFEAVQVKLKFVGTANSFEMYDMTARHGMKPQHLHKLARMADADLQGPNITYMGKEEPVIKGVGIGAFGGASNKTVWDFTDLMEMPV